MPYGTRSSMPSSVKYHHVHLVSFVNIDNPKVYSNTRSSSGLKRTFRMSEQARNVTLSFNLFEKTPNYDYIFDFVKRYGFKNLRLKLLDPGSDALKGKRTHTFLSKITSHPQNT